MSKVVIYIIPYNKHRVKTALLTCIILYFDCGIFIVQRFDLVMQIGHRFMHSDHFFVQGVYFAEGFSHCWIIGVAGCSGTACVRAQVTTAESIAVFFLQGFIQTHYVLNITGPLFLIFLIICWCLTLV